jgi:DNA-binding MarR family transcriptional regulator
MSKKKPQSSAQPSSRNRLAYDILRTAAFLRRSYADLFDRREITYQQYNVLRILRGAGPGGLPTLDIMDRMIDQAPGITRLLDRLERKSLIRRERPASNRRKVICYVTEKALILLQEIDPDLHSRVRAMSRCLRDREVTLLLRYLERIRTCPAPSSSAPAVRD